MNRRQDPAGNPAPSSVVCAKAEFRRLACYPRPRNGLSLVFTASQPPRPRVLLSGYFFLSRPSTALAGQPCSVTTFHPRRTDDPPGRTPRKNRRTPPAAGQRNLRRARAPAPLESLLWGRVFPIMDDEIRTPAAQFFSGCESRNPCFEAWAGPSLNPPPAKNRSPTFLTACCFPRFPPDT